MNNVRQYIERVIQEACDSEKRPNDVKFEYQLLPDKTLLFSIKTQYLRVQRRVIYRLHKNLKKNFGLTFNQLYPDPIRMDSEIREEAVYDLYPVSQGVDPNHSCLPITVFGKRYTIRSLYGIRPDEELGMPHLTKLKEHGFDFEANYPPEKVWEIFVKAYIDAYGDPPMKEALIQKDYYQFINVNKKRYEEDEKLHGCGYWSVCSDHACPCSNNVNTSTGFSKEIWDRMEKDLIEFKGLIISDVKKTYARPIELKEGNLINGNSKDA